MTTLTLYYATNRNHEGARWHPKGNAERLGHNGAARSNQLHNKAHQVDCSKIVEGITEHRYYLWATVNGDIRQSIDDIAFNAHERKRTGYTGNTWEIN